MQNYIKTLFNALQCWVEGKLANTVNSIAILEEKVDYSLNNKINKKNPIGTGSFSMNRKKDSSIGDYSAATGLNTEATEHCANAEGSHTKALGDSSHAEGSFTTASGSNSHAEGYSTTASGNSSHAEGSYTTASGHYTHAEGGDTIAYGDYSHAEGNAYQRRIKISGNGKDVKYTVSSGYDYIKVGSVLYYEGVYATVISKQSNTTITTNKTLCSTTALNNVYAKLIEGVAYGNNSHTEGYRTTASGSNSHAEGESTIASGNYSHAEGAGTIASGSGSHVEGYNTTASGDHSHAEGYNTTASGGYSHAEGEFTKSIGWGSHAEGSSTIASGNYSHAEGWQTIASGDNQHVQGKFNIKDSADTYAHIVGNGESDTARSNAHTLDWEGNAWFAGSVEGTALILLSPNGTRFNITVGDDGVLSATKITE